LPAGNPQPIKSLLVRFWTFGPFAAALLAIVAPTMPAGADWYGLQDKVPYGAASLGQTDLARFSKSISYQLWRAGMGGAKLDLFPPAPTTTDGWFQPGPPLLVRGLNARSTDYAEIQAHMDMYPYDDLKLCRTTAFQREGMTPDLVEVGLHEAAHYVSFRLGLDQSAYAAVRRKVDAYNANPGVEPAYKVDVSLQNVREDIADASAILYIYSNYTDVATNDAEAQAKADMRVSAFFDSEHETSNAIAAARAAFLRNPRHGLTIVETTWLAADVVRNEPAQDLDTRLQAARQVRDPMLHDPAFEARLVIAYERFRAIRNRFCGVTSVASAR
jgi:hypothetical protein